MGSTADHQHDFKNRPDRCDVCNAVQGNCACSLKVYEERRVPPKQWEQRPENYPDNYPVPCPITEQVVKDLKTRSALGFMKYGTTLARRDLTLRDWLQHQYEELLDAAKYCKRAISELDAQNESL